MSLLVRLKLQDYENDANIYYTWIHELAISKTQKMVLDTSLLNTQRYKVRIKGKVEQSREKSSTLPYTFYFIYGFTGPLAKGVEYSPMVQETRVQSQDESYQRLKKWYLMMPCLTLSIIRYISRVKWCNPGKGVVPSPTPWCSSYRKGSLQVILD